MTTRTTAILIALVGIFFIGFVASPTMADAQKKSKSKTTVKKEQQEERSEPAVVPEHPASITQPVTPYGGILDILKKYVGQKTNLGVLKKATRDVVEFDDEGTVLSVPPSNIHSLKQVTEKDENDSTVVRLEVRLIAKD